MRGGSAGCCNTGSTYISTVLENIVCTMQCIFLKVLSIDIESLSLLLSFQSTFPKSSCSGAVSRTCPAVSFSLFFSRCRPSPFSRLCCVLHSTASVGVTTPVTLDDGPSAWLLGRVWSVSPLFGTSRCSTGGLCSSVIGTSASDVVGAALQRVL